MVVPEFLDNLSAVEGSIVEIEDRKPDDLQVGDLVLALFEDGAFYRAGNESVEHGGLWIKLFEGIVRFSLSRG